MTKSPHTKKGAKPEEEENLVERTPAQMLVDEYRGRVEKRLESEFGLPMNKDEGANPE
jgi:hypothetical protein